MIVSLETRTPCQGDGCSRPIRMIMTATVVINKRSMRTTGTLIGAFEFIRCPDCGTEVQRGGEIPREPYRLVAEDAVKVAEYRKRKWGVEDTGAAVERVAG